MSRKVCIASVFLSLLCGSALSQATGETVEPEEVRTWTFYDDSAENIVSLAYSIPESDDVGVMFWCNPKSGTIKLFMSQRDEALKAGDPLPFQFTAGTKIFAKTGKLTENEMDGTPSLEADIDAIDPFFTSLKDTKDFSIGFNKHAETFPSPVTEMDKLAAACTAQKTTP